MNKKLKVKEAWGGHMNPKFPKMLREIEMELKTTPGLAASDFDFISVYFPCWIGDGESARMWEQEYPQSYAEYVERIKILDEYGFHKECLLQQGYPIEERVIEKYLNLGIKRFTVRNNENARLIKKLGGNDVHVMASVTKCLSPDEIINDQDLECYDEICLYFFYNRSVDSIRRLPKKFKYCLMPNIACSPHCKLALVHWFEPNYDRQEMECVRRRGGITEEMGSVSRAEFDSYFSQYIETVKIIGRESDANNLLQVTKHFLMYDNGELCRPEEHFSSEREFPTIVGKGVL